MITESVGQFQIFIISYPALYPPHLLEGVAELVEECLQPGVLQTGDVDETSGQFNIIIGELLVSGRHLV